MFRFLFKVGVLAVMVGGIAYAFGYGWDDSPPARERIAEIGDAAREAASKVDTERVMKAGAEVASRIEAGADRAGTALAEGRLTAKIRSKMALDDTLGDSELDVDTQGTVVTVRGAVDTAAQRQRALQLARETDGVTSVIDRIELRD